MPRLPFRSFVEAASFAEAIGFGEDFFGSGQLTSLVEQYKAERGLDESGTEVEVELRSGENFLVNRVRVAKRYVVFYTEADERICVPHREVVRVRIGRRARATTRPQPGFTVERIDESP